MAEMLSQSWTKYLNLTSSSPTNHTFLCSLNNLNCLKTHVFVFCFVLINYNRAITNLHSKLWCNNHSPLLLPFC